MCARAHELIAPRAHRAGQPRCAPHPHCGPFNPRTLSVLQSRREFVSIAGLRIDGRRPGEVRRIQCKLGLLSKVDGSALYEQGNTKVVAVVRGPRQVKSRSKAQHDRAVINCDYRCAGPCARPR